MKIKTAVFPHSSTSYGTSYPHKLRHKLPSQVYGRRRVLRVKLLFDLTEESRMPRERDTCSRVPT
jgi:hypothetical protein